MSLPRVAGVVLSLLCTGSLIAQETAEIPERAANWAAPPYWSPQPPSKDVEPILQGADESGIHPMGALPSPPLPFTAINPCRIVDTRGTVSPFGGPAMVANAFRTFILPAGPCPGLPSDAGAWSLNFTVIGGPGTFQGGFLTAWSTGSSQPLVSTLNFNANQLVANAAVVPAGTSGAIDVFVNAPAHLLIDVNGYYKGQAIVNTVNGLSGTVTLAAGSNVSITPSGQALTIASTGGGSGWSLTGNAGTTPGTHFLGTTDSQPLELRVNGERALRIEPLSFSGTWGPNMIGGFAGNFVTGGKVGGTIGGGGQNGLVNRVVEDFGTVGGGWNNLAQGYAAVVDGGRDNVASGEHTSLGGGRSNTASGGYASIPGGLNNVAGGDYSLAAGRRAKANHPGSFVWGDSTDADVASTANNQFVVRANGGARFLLSGGVVCTLDAVGWNCVAPSDRTMKRNIEPVDGRRALARLAALPIQTWSYIDHRPAVRHMGPMAQDFAAAFGLGADDKTINPLDANGVALAAIQGLYAEVQELRKRLAALEGARD